MGLERQTRSFLDPQALAPLGAAAVVGPPADAGQRFRQALQPPSRVERRICRVSQIRAGRRPAAARLAGLRTHRPSLHQGVGGRHQSPLLVWSSTRAARWPSAPARSPRSISPSGSPAASPIWPFSRATPSAWQAWPTSVVTEIPPRRNPAHLVPVFDLLEKIEPTGGTQLVPLLHELAETIRQRALVVIISDLFADPAELRGAFEHFRFRKHDLAAFHLLDPLELDFTFHRPMRFLDMEGGPAVFAEPNDIADRYLTGPEPISRRRPAGRHRDGRRLPSRPHRLRLRASVAEFSDRPHAGRERAMSFLQPWMLFALPIAALPVIIHLINQRRFQSIQWAAMRFLLEANRMSRGLRQAPPMVDPAGSRAGDRRARAPDQPPAGHRLAGARRRRPARHDAHPRRPLGQHDAARLRAAVLSKLETGIAQLAQTLGTLGSSRWVVIDSVTMRADRIAIAGRSSPSRQRSARQRRRRSTGDAASGPRLHQK